jgi:hypothetical protein
MSRAGKFIPGGSGKSGRRTGPIRAPEPGSAPGGDPSTPGGKKKPFGKGLGFNKPVAKNQKLPIAIMSGAVCCLLVSAAWYFMAYLPAKKQHEADVARYNQMVIDDANDRARVQKQHDDEVKATAEAHGTLTVDSNPTGASVGMGDFKGTTPASFADASPGPYTVVIKMDGYEDYRQDVIVTADKSTSLGIIQLVPKEGNLALTSPQSNVTYTITGPNGYTHDGPVPEKLEKLPIGDYTINAQQDDWKLPPIHVAIHDHDNDKKDIRFPYANLSIVSTPPGATVRQGHTVLGQTPLALPSLKPQDMNVSIDLPPYTVQRLAIHLPDFGNVSRQVALVQDKDFIAASGIPMVWIPEGKYWAGKYLVRQGEFQTVANYNPSNFRSVNRPVEMISWDGATAFCDQLTQYEKKAGKLPAGYHYALPSEAQWEQFSADADLEQAAMSRSSTLSSTQEAGASEPNKYGLYDTLGNVWEWCSDNFDDKGDHSLRGGSWLSSPENFPNAGTRVAGAAKYTDRFTGFRVVLVPN